MAIPVSLKQLEIFHAVVRAGSISKATRAVQLSQPTISQQLAKMEKVLHAQLFRRRRSSEMTLTAAGEYWFRVAGEMLRRMDEVDARHSSHFVSDQLVLRFGVTPSLRGKFTEASARIALELKKFSRFDFVWALNSSEIVEMISSHRINCGVVNAAAVQASDASLHTVPLIRDRFVWAVPRHIPVGVIETVISTGEPPRAEYEGILRYVDVGPSVPWQKRTEIWYRNTLPMAMPYFGCMTHQAAADFVAAGLATSLVPLSLVPNLPEQVLSRLRLFDLTDLQRETVFVMPRHLQSLKPLADFERRLCAYVQRDMSHEALSYLEPFPIEAAA